jgi:UDP-glucuronate decarboxylase
MNPSDGRVVSNFIVQALKGKTSLSLEMDCKHAQYVDLVEGMIRMMNSDDSF